jgi:hypothetical protein
LAPTNHAHPAYVNSQVCRKSYDIHLMILEIFTNIQMFAHLIQDTAKFSASVCQLRVSEYAVNSLIQIKRDLSIQGAKADYSRVESYLKSRWSFWAIRIKVALDFVAYNLRITQNDQELTVFQSARDQHEYISATSFEGKKATYHGHTTDPMRYPQVMHSLFNPSRPRLSSKEVNRAHIITFMPLTRKRGTCAAQICKKSKGLSKTTF